MRQQFTVRGWSSELPDFTPCYLAIQYSLYFQERKKYQKFLRFDSRLCGCCRIGYAIAERLLRDGAKVMVSSRKERNVERAVERLREEEEGVEGLVCHVGKEEHRRRLLEEVKKESESEKNSILLLYYNDRQRRGLGGLIFWCPMQQSILPMETPPR